MPRPLTGLHIITGLRILAAALLAGAPFSAHADDGTAPDGAPGAGANGPAESPENELRLYVSGGLAIPSDPPEFSDLWDTGPAFGGAVGIRVSPFWEVVASVDYQRFPTDEQAQADDLLLAGFGDTFFIDSIEGREVTVVTVMASARFHVPTDDPAWSPYLGFGWGLFEVFTSDAQITAGNGTIGPITLVGDTDTAFGVQVGGGIQWAVAPGAFVVLDLVYTVGFTELISTQYLPVRLGLGFSL
ncbi:MAG: outer membrane beta-barrel protein [Gemmatimonadetes bacterium]|nr:outer membrane beta-barrel protein [Gemmatimonadota bacterium]